MDAADQMTNLRTHRNVGIADGVEIGRINHTMKNGYEATSTVVGVGGMLPTDNEMYIVGGINRITTDVKGAADGKITTNSISAGAGKALDEQDITISGRISMAATEMEYTRSVGDFNNAGKTSSKDFSGSIQLEKSTGTARPFVGITTGKVTRDEFAETGDVQSALSFIEDIETYRYATVGLNIDEGPLQLSISKNIGDNEALNTSIGITQKINDTATFVADFNKTVDGDNSSNYFTAGVKITF
jgi:hypothetical protein